MYSKTKVNTARSVWAERRKIRDAFVETGSVQAMYHLVSEGIVLSCPEHDTEVLRIHRKTNYLSRMQGKNLKISKKFSEKSKCCHNKCCILVSMDSIWAHLLSDGDILELLSQHLLNSRNIRSQKLEIKKKAWYIQIIK